jgi:hypothetical protein
MKYLLLLIVIFINIELTYSQHHFQYIKKDLDFVKQFEDSLESTKLGFVKTNVAKDYFPTEKEKTDYFPLSFIRTTDTFYPELHIKYYYSEIDSTLLSSSYDWNIMNYVKNIKTDGHKFEKEKKRKKEYLAKYNSIKNEIIAKYGEPTSVEETKNSSGYFYRIEWDNTENEILMLFKFSTKLKYLPGNIIIGSYNIRVKVDYK